MNQQKSFGITIRPKCGVIPNSTFEKKILKVCKRADYYHVVAEKAGVDRHLHIQLWYDEPKYKGDIKKNFVRACSSEIWWDANHKKYSIEAKFCYNDWVTNYCEENDLKLDPNDTLLDNIPADTDPYYPTDEEQEKMLNKATAVDQKFYGWEQMYMEYPEKVEHPTLWDIANFLGDMMFVSRKIPVIIDHKARQQNCKCLLAYIQKSKSAKLFMTADEYETEIIKITSHGTSNS